MTWSGVKKGPWLAQVVVRGSGGLENVARIGGSLREGVSSGQGTSPSDCMGSGIRETA